MLESEVDHIFCSDSAKVPHVKPWWTLILHGSKCLLWTLAVQFEIYQTGASQNVIEAPPSSHEDDVSAPVHQPM